MTTQQTTTETPAAAPPALPEGADETSLDTRAAALLEQLATEQKAAAREEANPPIEPSKLAVAAKTEGDKPVETPDAQKTPEQIAEDRRERIKTRDAEIQRLAEEERARVATSRSKKQAPEPTQTPQAGVTITDAASFFAAAEKLQIPPQELAAWLTNQNDPAKAAEAAAKRTLSPVEEKLSELQAQYKALEDSIIQRDEKAHVAALVEQNRQILVRHLDTVKAEAPLAAAFNAKNPAKFMRAVESICDGLPPGFTAQDVIDQIEENLSDLQLNGSIAAPAANSTTKRTEKPAAAKANVGNRLAAERATTVEDDGDDAEGDLEERARKLKARLAAG